MFNAFLTTALEVVILLDILGVIIYFIISGISRARRPVLTPAFAGGSGVDDDGLEAGRRKVCKILQTFKW